MPPQGLLLIAAYMPESWPVRFIDENIAPATAEDFAWADVVMVTGMHIQCEQINDIRAAPRQPARSRCWAGRRCRPRPRCIRTFDYLHQGELGDSTDAIVKLLDESVDAARNADGVQHQAAPAADRFSDPRLQRDSLRPLSARHGAVLVRLPLHLRVLRHPRPLRPPAAHEDAGAGRRRTRRHLLAAQPAGDALLRRRQFHRQPQGRQGDAAASRRVAEAQPLPGRCSPARRRSTSPSRRTSWS